MKTRKGLLWAETLILMVCSTLCIGNAALNVVILDQSNPNLSNISFLAQEARFGPILQPSGISGPVYEVENRGCESFSKPQVFESITTWIALIIRGECTFETKVMNAQNAGASFVFVYNNVSTFGNSLIAMNGGSKSEEIDVPSAFISKESGEKLIQVMSERGNLNTIVVVLPSTKPTSDVGGVSGHWAVIVFVGILAILISSFFILIFLIVEIYRQRRRRRRRRNKRVPQEVIIKIPVQKVTEEDLKNEEKNLTCAICLDDYQLDDETRKLPCDHEFHKACIDPWFHRNRLCPVCKRDVQNGVEVIYQPRNSRSSRDTRDSSLDSNRPSDIEMQAIPREGSTQLGRIAEEGESELSATVVRSLSEVGLINLPRSQEESASSSSPSPGRLRGLFSRFRIRRGSTGMTRTHLEVDNSDEGTSQQHHHQEQQQINQQQEEQEHQQELQNSEEVNSSPDTSLSIPDRGQDPEEIPLTYESRSIRSVSSNPE